ncbi:transcriptional repressor [Candidatus Woesearchaeota archaeon]|nr:transcriptional repressor [Candidatus Woesearchaeota archaeon]
MASTRNTPQREAILAYLQSVHTHPTAEEVHAAVSRKLLSIALATVYRNLNLLAERGIIHRHQIGGGYRYDADLAAHEHCVCTSCGGIYDVPAEDIEAAATRHIDRKRFVPDHVEVTVYGVCAKCDHDTDTIRKVKPT